MIVHDNTYSRAVAWLKILLPLLALAILSTLFLVARTVTPAQDLPFADVDIEELASEQGIGKPNYAGVTGDGAAIALTAESAMPDPDNPERLTGTGIRAGIERPGGTRIDVTAATMLLDHSARVAGLGGGVEIETTDGYKLRTKSIEFALETTHVSSNHHTTLTGPLGRVSAESFVLTDENRGLRPYVLVFKGSVKLIYDPEQ